MIHRVRALSRTAISGPRRKPRPRSPRRSDSVLRPRRLMCGKALPFRQTVFIVRGFASESEPSNILKRDWKGETFPHQAAKPHTLDSFNVETKSATYASAGVDIDAANRATEKIKELARATFNDRTLSEIGSFGGMFDGAFPGMRQPVLVASADGVGTKLKIAFATGIHNTIGRDLV